MTAEPEFIVAFRTHIWNADVAAMAHRLHGRSTGTRFVIIADETNGSLETDPFEKLSHTKDFSEFGLPSFPQRVLWHNADYPLYCLRHRFPAASHYAMVEFDVAVNIELAPVFYHAKQEEIDLIASNLGDAHLSWGWTKTVAPYFARPMMSFIQVLIVSGRSIDYMLQRRQQIFQETELKQPEDWPFCEAFIPSAVMEMPNPKMEKLRVHASLALYSIGNAIHMDDPEAAAPGTIAHPVLPGKNVAAKRLAREQPETIFDPGSPLRRQLSFCDPGDFILPLVQRMRMKHGTARDSELLALARQMGWAEEFPEPNIALRKPATQSSTSQWSRHALPDADAAGGNNGIVKGGFGFHTSYEQDPWWQVDLQAEIAISRVVVFNRMIKTGCTRMALFGSADGENWHLLAAKLDDSIFGGVDGNPYTFRFTPPPPRQVHSHTDDRRGVFAS